MLNENWQDEISTTPLSELTERSHSFTGVHSRSKKIRKTSSKDQSPRYRTFTNSDKRTIIADLKKFVSRLQDFEQNSADEDFLELLKSVQRKELNTFLKSCLPNYMEEFDDSTENLRIWRRRIKDWVKNFNQPETRGSLLVPHEKLDVFKHHLIQAVQGLKFRSLKLLRPKLFDIFELIGRPLKNRTTCSKHWWYDFMKANLDVKECWDALPKRQSKTGRKGSEETDSEEGEEEEEEKMEEVVSSQSRKVSFEEEDNQIGKMMEEVNFNELCLAPVGLKEQEEDWSNQENSSGLSPHLGEEEEYSNDYFRKLLGEPEPQPRIDAHINWNAMEK